VLTGSAGRARQAGRVAAAAIDAPVACYALGVIDTEGVLGAALRARADSVHVVRPDGHLAAVLPHYDPAALTAALRRATGAGPLAAL
jgi:hypothetical protein